MNRDICRECGNLHTRFESCGATGQQTVKALWEERDQLRRELEGTALQCVGYLKKFDDMKTERDEAVALLKSWMTPPPDHSRTKFRLRVLNLLKRLDGEGGE